MVDFSFARDATTLRYYERRASEYDEWYTGEGVFAARDRPGWPEELDAVIDLLTRLPSVRTLDVACGTGFLTRHLAGRPVGLDRSPAMARIARERLANGTVVLGDALRLPFAEGSFTRVLAGHFYGHLPPPERAGFRAEARRVAEELVVVDSALRPGVEPEGWSDRVLNDGSQHSVYKRYFTAPYLAEELGGGEVLFGGDWFVAVRARL
jgi:ubiquinone/menaquinone biosynthesis C-methylase UbiE